MLGVVIYRTLLLFSSKFALLKRHGLRLFSNSMLKFVSSNTLLAESILVVFYQWETPKCVKQNKIR